MCATSYLYLRNTEQGHMQKQLLDTGDWKQLKKKNDDMHFFLIFLRGAKKAKFWRDDTIISSYGNDFC